MIRTVSLLALVVVAVACADNEPPPEMELRIALVGQSLSRYDPRDYIESPAATVVPILSAADVAFTNLEVSVDGEGCPCVPTKEGNSLQVARPPVVEFLSEMNFGLLSLANNHSWNLSEGGVRSSIQAADANGLTHAGTGTSSAEAVAAGVRSVRGQQIGLIANATVKLGADAAAGPSKPGVNLLRVGNVKDWERNLVSVRAASDSLDVLIVYQHFQVTPEDVAPGNEFGHGLHSDLDAWQQEWARAAIDNGASLYVAHGSREFRGVEIYRGRPIFYGLGNFIFHSGQPVGHYERDVWESVVATVTFDGVEPSRVEFTPLVLDEGTPGDNFLESRGVPEVAEGPLASSILERLVRLSAVHGTVINVTGERAVLDLKGGLRIR